jgi:S-(hydroxymethyl)glutathione dehydrogenase/alcohol dehydrogenase
LKALILREVDAPLEICDVELTKLKLGQVLVRVLVSGVCGSQLAEIRGEKGNQKYMPHLLGHEGCGIVEEIGPGVSRVTVGDKVVMHWRETNGIDSENPTYILDGSLITSGKVTTLSEYSIASENRLTVVPHETPNDYAALLGCCITTALSTINRECEVYIGESVGIVGCGGVGLALIWGAQLAGAAQIVGIDVQQSKSHLAQKLGTTGFIDSSQENLASGLERLGMSKTLDVIIDTTGNPELVRQASQLLSDQGRLVLVGQPAKDEGFIIPDFSNFLGKNGRKVIFTQGGGTIPHLDIPRYVKLLEKIGTSYTQLIGERVGIAGVNSAIEHLKTGQAGRILVEFNTK